MITLLEVSEQMKELDMVGILISYNKDTKRVTAECEVSSTGARYSAVSTNYANALLVLISNVKRNYGFNKNIVSSSNHACVGGCGSLFSSIDLIDGRVMRVASGPNKDLPVCGSCLQKLTSGKNHIPSHESLKSSTEE